MPRPTVPVIAVVSGALAINGRPILRQIDLVVKAGEFVALMGANGSGKSTLIRAVTGLHTLTHGSATLFGTPVSAFRSWHRIGFVPQRNSATGGVPASVRELVSSGRLSRRHPFQPMRHKDRYAVDAAIVAVGLQDRARDGVATLSGGQQQRALIARALAGQPELFLLDEPTAGVDLATQETLAIMLGQLKSAGSTVVLVAHELGPLASLVDRTVVMRDGRIVYSGAPMSDHALHQPAYGEHPAVLSESHTHHHPGAAHVDHTPQVEAPLDGIGGHAPGLGRDTR
ncbi:MAG: metal ABC transporter ATP-binding protein [Nocardioides sp.]